MEEVVAPIVRSQALQRQLRIALVPDITLANPNELGDVRRIAKGGTRRLNGSPEGKSVGSEASDIFNSEVSSVLGSNVQRRSAGDVALVEELKHAVPVQPSRRDGGESVAVVGMGVGSADVEDLLSLGSGSEEGEGG